MGIKQSLFADDLIVYIQNPTNATKKLFNLINEVGKTVGYKVNIQKLDAFVHTNNKMSETEFRKKIPLGIASRKIKYLGINLTKEVKDLYSENYTTLKKKLRKTQINGSIYCVHGLKEVTSLKYPYYPKQSRDSTQFLL